MEQARYYMLFYYVVWNSLFESSFDSYVVVAALLFVFSRIQSVSWSLLKSQLNFDFFSVCRKPFHKPSIACSDYFHVPEFVDSVGHGMLFSFHFHPYASPVSPWHNCLVQTWHLAGSVLEEPLSCCSTNSLLHAILAITLCVFKHARDFFVHVGELLGHLLLHSLDPPLIDWVGVALCTLACFTIRALTTQGSNTCHRMFQLCAWGMWPRTWAMPQSWALPTNPCDHTN